MTENSMLVSYEDGFAGLGKPLLNADKLVVHEAPPVVHLTGLVEDGQHGGSRQIACDARVGPFQLGVADEWFEEIVQEVFAVEAGAVHGGPQGRLFVRRDEDGEAAEIVADRVFHRSSSETP